METDMTDEQLESRIASLGRQLNSEIAIWCDDASHVPATIDEMIADGELREADRPRCVHWAAVRIAGISWSIQ
jgi:hypothetical protein